MLVRRAQLAEFKQDDRARSWRPGALPGLLHPRLRPEAGRRVPERRAAPASSSALAIVHEGHGRREQGRGFARTTRALSNTQAPVPPPPSLLLWQGFAIRRTALTALGAPVQCRRAAAC